MRWTDRHIEASYALWLPAVLAAASCGQAQSPAAGEPQRDQPQASEFRATEQGGDIEARLQAVHALDSGLVWVSGLDGSVGRSRNGGESWEWFEIAGAEELQFRDLHAFDSQRAVLLSSGEGEASRVYRTDDGGASWRRLLLNAEPEGFLDCISFWGASHGVIYGDSVDGYIYVLLTKDGGSTWTRLAPDALPPALPGEGGFAASGTCVETRRGGLGWIATGAGGAARVLRTVDGGQSWAVSDTPLVSGKLAGVMSLQFADDKLGFAFGGNLDPEGPERPRVATTADGGKEWLLGGEPSLSGAVYGAAIAGDAKSPVVVAVGPGGIELSTDGARSWTRVGDADYWSADFGDPSRFWAVGPDGRITRFDAR